MNVKRSISLTKELDNALECIALAQATTKSRVIENYLREHGIIKKQIEAMQMEPETGLLAVSRRMISEIKPTDRRQIATAASS